MARVNQLMMRMKLEIMVTEFTLRKVIMIYNEQNKDFKKSNKDKILRNKIKTRNR